jgi:acyl carrier protein
MLSPFLTRLLAKPSRLFRAPLFSFGSATAKSSGHDDHSANHKGGHAEKHPPKKKPMYTVLDPNDKTDDEIAQMPIRDYMVPKTKTKTMYFTDPEGIAIRVCAIIALHDELKVKEIRLEHTWKDLGLSELAKMEIIIELENEMDISLPEDATEQWRTLHDVVQYIAKSPHMH